MTRYAATSLDLSDLPAPLVVENISFDAILAVRKATLVEEFRTRGVDYDVDMLETDSATIQQRVDGGREVLVRQKINDAAKATMLAFATGSDLDHLAALYGISRRLISPATASAAAVYESDAELRRRVQIAPEALTTCGSEASYVHHALEAAPALVDVVPLVGATASGEKQVRVVCLDRGPTGIPSPETLEACRARLTRTDVRPMTVPVSISGPAVVTYDVVMRLVIPAGPDPSLVRSAALTAVTALVAARRGLGVDVLRQAVEAAGRVSGVERVILDAPDDIVVASDAVPICTSLTITPEGLDD